MAIGEKQAQMVHQIDFWLSMPRMGYVVNGKKYIRNTLNDWISPENFPHWSLRTVRRVFDKLVELGILLKKKIKNGWDQTLGYTLDYTNKLLVDAGYKEEIGQNGQIDVAKMDKSKWPKRTDGSGQNGQMFKYRYNPETTNRDNLQRAGVSESGSTSEQQGKANYRLEFPLAESWLAGKEKSFQLAVDKYAALHCNKSSVKFPRAVRMRIIVEIWKKFQGLPSLTDFEYVDHSLLKEHNVPSNVEFQPTREQLLERELERYHDENFYRT
jgi:hypothetical protein